MGGCLEQRDARVLLTSSIILCIHQPCKKGEKYKEHEFYGSADRHTGHIFLAEYHRPYYQLPADGISHSQVKSLRSLQERGSPACVTHGTQNYMCFVRALGQRSHREWEFSATGLSMWLLRLTTSIWYFQQDQSTAHTLMTELPLLEQSAQHNCRVRWEL